ncbi:TIR domain-containing protein [Paenibacillus sp. TAB 01]|uniref:TIR domain-containing protein n=1 Tax=Paenibacillus sp. TAB 01 TaxID=3368988 RepID=UPI003751D4D2
MRPKLFIGCSPNGTLLSEFYQTQLASQTEAAVVNQGILSTSNPILKRLDRQLKESDFGLIVLTGADFADPSMYANLIFLTGLFIGELGYKRTFIVMPKGHRLPDYLEGFNPLALEEENGEPRLERAGVHLYPIRQAISGLKLRYKLSDYRKADADRQFLFSALDALNLSGNVDYDRVLDKFHKTFDPSCGIIEFQEVTAATLFELLEDGVTLKQFARAGQVGNNHTILLTDKSSYLAECCRAADINVHLGRAKDKEDGVFEYIYCVKLHPTIISSLHFTTDIHIPPHHHHTIMMELSQKNAKLVSSLKSIVKGRINYAEAHEESS